MNEAYLEEIKARSGKATPGPWTAEFPTGRDTQWFDIVAGPNGEEILHGETEPLLYWVHPTSQAAVLSATEATKANLEFAAHARTDIDNLTAFVEKLLEELRRSHKDHATVEDKSYCSTCQLLETYRAKPQESGKSTAHMPRCTCNFDEGHEPNCELVIANDKRLARNRAETGEGETK